MPIEWDKNGKMVLLGDSDITLLNHVDASIDVAEDNYTSHYYSVDRWLDLIRNASDDGIARADRVFADTIGDRKKGLEAIQEAYQKFKIAQYQEAQERKE